MVALNEIVGKVFSGISFNGILGQGITFILFTILLAAGGGAIVYFVVQKKKFNQSVVILEEGPDGTPMIQGRDKARLIKFGDMGEEYLKLQRNKTVKPARGNRIGLRQYAFVIGRDGLWYNANFASFDKALGKIGIVPVDPRMREFNVAIRKINQREFQKQNLLEKYAPYIGFFFIILVMSIGFWFTTREMRNVASELSAAVNTGNKIMETSQHLLEANANIAHAGGVALITPLTSILTHGII